MGDFPAVSLTRYLPTRRFWTQVARQTFLSNADEIDAVVKAGSSFVALHFCALQI